ncbi:MAG: hypothetical protein JXB24_12690 [Bacteroidales bacterium]|nr:hypothetical protein [Bacteroidales bacterium]
MRDELQRNTEQLCDKKYEKPFFIAYTIADVQNIYINATLGAIYTSETRSYKDWQVRVMVGDYDINDENFNYDQPQEIVFRPSIEMPVDDDYEGIRRSLWLTTNNVYNSAAQTYKVKMDLIDHKQLKESDLQIPDFSHAPVVKMNVQSPEISYDTGYINNLTKELSRLFCQSPEIYYSDVGCNIFLSNVYFINSEGTEVKFPYNLASLVIQAGTMTDDSERIHRKIAYTCNAPDEFPDLQDISMDIKIMIDDLLMLRKASRLEEDYTGPVLVLNEAVANTFETVLFTGFDQLIANRESLQSSSQMNLYYDKSDNGLESKINKLILSRDLTITAESLLNEFEGIPLLGSFHVDAEGVIPPENLVLVENGILKTLLNGRTPSRNVQESNGHMRFDYGFGGLVKQIGPGVIKVTSSNPFTFNDLKEKMIQKAREEGLEYGIIIKSLEVGGSIKPINIIRVSTESGHEEIVRSARIKPPSLNNLKKHLGVSGNFLVHNTILSGSSNRKSTSYITGMPVSFIVPDAILLEDIELESVRQPLTSLLPFIENPVGLENLKTIDTK